MGTPEFAVPTLESIVAAGHEVVSVITQPDRPKGRRQELSPSPVKAAALRLGVPVYQPERIRRPESAAHLRELAPDLMVVVGYGQIIPQSIIDMAPLGIINVHGSLLPKYRGAAPIQWAILNGDAQTGVTIMKMDAGLDTGPMLTQATTPIASTDNAQTLHDRLAELGGELLVKTIPDFVAGKITQQPQPAEGVNYARKISKEDGLIDWSQPSQVIWNRVRGFTPWPGAFTHFPVESQPRLLKVWSAEVEPNLSGAPGTILRADKDVVVACGQQALRILQLQREGGRRMTAQEFLAGHPLAAGSRLGP